MARHEVHALRSMAPAEVERLLIGHEVRTTIATASGSAVLAITGTAEQVYADRLVIATRGVHKVVHYRQPDAGCYFRGTRRGGPAHLLVETT